MDPDELPLTPTTAAADAATKDAAVVLPNGDGIGERLRFGDGGIVDDVEVVAAGVVCAMRMAFTTLLKISFSISGSIDTPLLNDVVVNAAAAVVAIAVTVVVDDEDDEEGVVNDDCCLVILGPTPIDAAVRRPDAGRVLVTDEAVAVAADIAATAAAPLPAAVRRVADGGRPVRRPSIAAPTPLSIYRSIYLFVSSTQLHAPLSYYRGCGSTTRNHNNNKQ
jgi:hypothetical protein